jgi:hypothetical protein|tara:strand:- start:2110 stop:2265 length:156 start_codon:yes stop_codon:yes gene_type:complete
VLISYAVNNVGYEEPQLKMGLRYAVPWARIPEVKIPEVKILEVKVPWLKLK